MDIFIKTTDLTSGYNFHPHPRSTELVSFQQSCSVTSLPEVTLIVTVSLFGVDDFPKWID